jgi:hypothetical protein
MRWTDEFGNDLVPPVASPTVTVQLPQSVRIRAFYLPFAGVRFVRGDTNADGRVNIGDAVCALTYLFGDQGDPCKMTVANCFDMADANDDGKVNIGDPIRILGYLFGNAGPLAAPFDACGIDPNMDTLNCASFDPCKER